MPRKHLARRFEPRFGVSQIVIDEESKYVARELEDRLVWSAEKLTDHLSKVRAQLDRIELELQSHLSPLSPLEQLALRGMLARDFLHIAVLYRTLLTSHRTGDDVRGGTPLEHPSVENPEPVVPFRETLFG